MKRKRRKVKTKRKTEREREREREKCARRKRRRKEEGRRGGGEIRVRKKKKGEKKKQRKRGGGRAVASPASVDPATSLPCLLSCMRFCSLFCGGRRGREGRRRERKHLLPHCTSPAPLGRLPPLVSPQCCFAPSKASRRLLKKAQAEEPLLSAATAANARMTTRVLLRRARHTRAYLNRRTALLCALRGDTIALPRRRRL